MGHCTVVPLLAVTPATIALEIALALDPSTLIATLHHALACPPYQQRVHPRLPRAALQPPLHVRFGLQYTEE